MGALGLIGSVLSNSWAVLTSIVFPGTGMSIAVILIGSAMVCVSLKLIGNIFGFSIGGTISSIKRSGQKGGNNKNIKVNNARKGDTH